MQFPRPIRSAWRYWRGRSLPDTTYAELVTLVIGGRLPIVIMALTVIAVATLAHFERPDGRALGLAGGILILLVLRTLLVTAFIRATKAGPLPIETIRRWEVRYARVVIPYAILLGLFSLHLVVTSGEAVRLLVAIETYGFCAGMVSRGFVRPQLCALMVLIVAFPTAAGFFIVAANVHGLHAITFAIVGALIAVYALTSLETVRHLYGAMLTQLATKRELAAFARIDPLTGLANRLAMREKLVSEKHRDGHRLFAILSLDLDGFKAVNDEFGHPAGDRLLREIGRRLMEAMDEGDMAVRMGGDEFCVVQTSIEQDIDAEAMGNRLIKALNEPFFDNGTLLQVGSSIGVALEDGSVDDIDLLLERADSALYRAKRYGGNTLRVWRSSQKLNLVA
jgi:diguanylate cyclase (GGDEF)-like protein